MSLLVVNFDWLMITTKRFIFPIRKINLLVVYYIMTQSNWFLIYVWLIIVSTENDLLFSSKVVKQNLRELSKQLLYKNSKFCMKLNSALVIGGETGAALPINLGHRVHAAVTFQVRYFFSFTIFCLLFPANGQILNPSFEIPI